MEPSVEDVCGFKPYLKVTPGVNGEEDKVEETEWMECPFVGTMYMPKRLVRAHGEKMLMDLKDSVLQHVNWAIRWETQETLRKLGESQWIVGCS